MHIPIIDDTIGGLLPGQLHSINGESGVGKTIFCIRAIHCLFQLKAGAKVLFCESSSNLRLSVLEKIISEEFLDQIDILKPKSLVEQIIFFRNLIENTKVRYDLIIFDTFLGSPLEAINYVRTGNKLWKKRIFTHLLDIRNIAETWKIPIMITEHIIPSKEEVNPECSHRKYGDDLIGPFVPIDFFLLKNNGKNFLEFRLFRNLLASSEFDLRI
jgi:archaellum biogenesis ATPase FlaH